MSVTFSALGTPFGDAYDHLHFNVANGSACRILRYMLDVEDEYLCGELDPNEVLRRLSVVIPDAHVVEGYDRQHETIVLDAQGIGVKIGPRVIFHGIDADRVARWVTGLRRVAQHAIKEGVGISYG